MVNKNVLQKALNLETLKQVGTDGPSKNVPAKRPKPEAKAFEKQSFEIDGDKGHIDIVREEVPKTDDEWKSILEFVVPKGMNAEDFTIDSTKPVRVSAWNQWAAADEEPRTLYAIRAYILRKNPEGLGVWDIHDAVMKAKRPKLNIVHSKERVLFIQITDLQAGQSDGGGAAAMVEKALSIPAHARAYIQRLKKAGTPVTKILIAITGDLVEGVIGFYGNQMFTVELDNREQEKVARRIIQAIIIDLAELGLPIHVVTVPGNHGQFRVGGGGHGSATTNNDNSDVAVIEQIADAFELAPEKFGHVTFSFPEGERLSLTIDVEGWTVGLIHGHQTGAGAGIEGKVTNWFAKQAATRDPIGSSDLLFIGHYHHLRCQQLIGTTVMIMGGALCDNSSHFAQNYGLTGQSVLVMGTITKEDVLENFQPVFFKVEQVA